VALPEAISSLPAARHAWVATRHGRRLAGARSLFTRRRKVPPPSRRSFVHGTPYVSAAADPHARGPAHEKEHSHRRSGRARLDCYRTRPSHDGPRRNALAPAPSRSPLLHLSRWPPATQWR